VFIHRSMKVVLQDPRAHNRVAVTRRPEVSAYPGLDAAPFHPSERYPEYAGPLARTPNHAYALVRETLAGLGLDAERFGHADWNPLGALVKPGGRIVVKPNWVLHANEGTGGTDCLITHASVLRAVLDYVMLAQPSAVVVGDAPVQVCHFDQVQALGFDQVAGYFRSLGAPVTVKDFRRTTMVRETHAAQVSEERHGLEEFVLVDLASRSQLEPIAGDFAQFRVTMYDPRKLPQNHRPGVHRYLVARDILEADLIINVPKLKTHKKAGLTLALKNLVGINGNKDYLPHHRKGGADRGGDNYAESSLPKFLAEATLDFANRHLQWPRFYARVSRFAYRWLFFDRIRGKSIDVEGGWHGNDTVWRMCLDLNKILLYADPSGRLHDQPQRATLHLADALVAGEGDGPLRSDPRPIGILLGSLNAAALDWVAAWLIGLDPARIPITVHAFGHHELPLVQYATTAISAVVNGQPQPLAALPAVEPPFTVPAGWRGHCERVQAT
jgi:uncharacterized protein (DUF362 family)